MSPTSVLVVDDERTIADTTALILNLKGYCAEAAHSVARAINCLRDQRPDVLIVDMFLKDGSGIDLAIRIRNTLPQVAILLFSGHAEADDLLKKARAEGYDFEILAKPVHPEELLRRIDCAAAAP